jgi:Protein of unknown function (DUF1565)
MIKMRLGYKLSILACLVGLSLLEQGCGSGGNSNAGTVPPPAPSVGANVNESLETVSVFVDGAAGNDSNNGSQSSPFQTINKALAVAGVNNQNSIGTQINVNPGIYREQLTVQASQTSLPFTLQSTGAGVVVSGADSLPGSAWTISAYGPDIYTNSATSSYIFAACAVPTGWPPIPAILLRREMVFINGVRLNQVMFSHELQPGTFWADADVTHQLYIWPPAGTNMSTADVEVSNAVRSPLLTTNNVNNFVVRGLTFEYDNACIQSGSRIENGKNILIDSDQFLWNNGQGFGLHGATGPTTENITVQNSKANHNGQMGFSGDEVKYVLYQNDESSYNSWRGAEGGYYEWAFDGSDFFLHHNSQFNGFRAYYNQSSGVHFDTDNANDQVTGMQSSGNNLEGLSIEANQGPFLVQNSTFCSNSLAPASKTGSLSVNDSSGVTLTGNVLYGGGPSQVYIDGGGRAGTNWEQPTVPLVRFNQNLTETGNTFIGNASQVGFSTYYKDSPSCSVPIPDMWQTFGDTLSSNTNTWGDTAATSSSYPFFDAAILGSTVPLATWQSPSPQGVGQDTASQFEPGASAPQQCALPQPDIPDFWLVLGPRGGAAVVVPQPGGPVMRVPINLFSLGFTGTVSLSVDTTQTGGSTVTGVSGSFSPQSLALSANDFVNPVASTLTIATASSTPDGFYTLTVTATDGRGMTRTGTLFLQVGSPTALQFQGTATTIQAGACAMFQIHSVNSAGDPSDVLADTYLNVTGTGSGRFYQDSRCSSPVSLSPVNTGCSAGIEISEGDYAPRFSGTESVWFMDPSVENLNITISDDAHMLAPVTTSVQVQ